LSQIEWEEINLNFSEKYCELHDEKINDRKNSQEKNINLKNNSRKTSRKFKRQIRFIILSKFFLNKQFSEVISKENSQRTKNNDAY
jgi:hypothetical protein